MRPLLSKIEQKKGVKQQGVRLMDMKDRLKEENMVTLSILPLRAISPKFLMNSTTKRSIV